MNEPKTSPAGSARHAEPPRLLHVFPSYGHGGVPIRIASILNHFGNRYRHAIFALDGNLAAASRLDPRLGVRLADPGIDKTRPLASLFRIRSALSRERPDLLLTYNWGSVEWALVNRLTRVARHIHLESGFGPEEADGQLPRRARLRRLALARTRCLIVPSFTLVDIARTAWRIDPAKIRHIPNGVDCDLFGGCGDPEAAPGFTPRAGELVVGTIAPLRAEKNLHRLIRGFAEIAPRFPAARLLIAGDGVERAALEKTATACGIAARTVFTGHVEQPHKVYPLMDVFAITSDTEQMPNTLIQAMAAGLPVAGVDVGDIKAILPPANRPLVVAKSDESGFAEALARLLEDRALRAELAAANRQHVLAEYSQDRMFSAYAAVFDAVLADRPIGARGA